jgi:hypothetical protein
MATIAGLLFATMHGLIAMKATAKCVPKRACERGGRLGNASSPLGSSTKMIVGWTVYGEERTITSQSV